jgi:hypothetical protein
MSDPEVVNSLRCSPLFAETADVEINALAASCRIQTIGFERECMPCT